MSLPADQRPDFITLYFDEPDLAGHQNGPSDEAGVRKSKLYLKLNVDLCHLNLIFLDSFNHSGVLSLNKRLSLKSKKDGLINNKVFP